MWGSILCFHGPTANRRLLGVFVVQVLNKKKENSNRAYQFCGISACGKANTTKSDSKTFIQLFERIILGT